VISVKGVNFFGPKSEFIVSGSDCGNVFFWDKHTESIVQYMHADENGVVSSLIKLLCV
jgi:WD repeat-containing protein 42A